MSMPLFRLESAPTYFLTVFRFRCRCQHVCQRLSQLWSPQNSIIHTYAYNPSLVKDFIRCTIWASYYKQTHHRWFPNED